MEMVPRSAKLCFNGKTKFVIGGEEIDLRGKFLFSWPYEWQERIDWDLIQTLCSDVETWIRGFGVEGIHDATSKASLARLKDGVLNAVLFSPVDWMERASTETQAYRKLLIYAEITLVLISIDDIADEEVGSDHHGELVRSISRVGAKIMGQEFESVQELQLDSFYQRSVQIIPNLAIWLTCLHQISLDTQQEIPGPKENFKYISRAFRYEFELQTWPRVAQSSHLLNTGLQQHLKRFTGGVITHIEMALLLDGIIVGPDIRENEYWDRCLKIAAYLPCQTNDVISLQKENLEEKSRGILPHNCIYIYMELENCSFEQALNRALREHDEALMELCTLLSRLQNEPEMTFELNEASKTIFFRSLKTIKEYVSRNIQAQIVLERYLKNIECWVENPDE